MLGMMLKVLGRKMMSRGEVIERGLLEVIIVVVMVKGGMIMKVGRKLMVVMDGMIAGRMKLSRQRMRMMRMSRMAVLRPVGPTTGA